MNFFFFLSRSLNVLIFYVTILKCVNFLQGAIYGKSSTFGSYQNHYQSNMYLYFYIKTI